MESVKDKVREVVKDTAKAAGNQAVESAKNKIEGHSDDVASASHEQLNKTDSSLNNPPAGQKYERNQPDNHPARDEASRSGHSSSATVQD